MGSGLRGHGALPRNGTCAHREDGSSRRLYARRHSVRLGEALTQSEKATLAGLRCRRRRREERCTNPDDGELNVQCRGLGHLRALVRFRRPTIVTAKLEAAGRPTRRLVRGGGLAAISGGLPSTAWALLTRGDPLAAAQPCAPDPPRNPRPPRSKAGGAACSYEPATASPGVVSGMVPRRLRRQALFSVIHASRCELVMPSSSIPPNLSAWSVAASHS